MKQILLFSLVLSLNLSSFAQPDVTIQPIIPYFLSQVIADGTVVSEVTVNGSPFDDTLVQAGTFIDPLWSVGMEEGIILGTGNVLMAEQLNTGAGSSLPGDGDFYSDSDLESITSVSVNDQIVLEFDFLAQGDSLYMEYIFASEEYPEYACSNFNDVLGVFLSGPRPGGGTYVAENIALVPEVDGPGMTMDAVGINSINPGVAGQAGGQADVCSDFAPSWEEYSVYYIENTDNLFEYDGLTSMLCILTDIVPGEFYHMKIAVGDGTDSAFDSAFLIRKNSFKTNYSSVVSSVTELERPNFKIYPNPAVDELFFESLVQIDGRARVQFFDISGRLVQEKVLDAGTTRIPIQELESGNYILNIQSDAGLLHRQTISVD